MDEIELKLALSTEAAAQLERALLAADPAVAAMHAVYYDTPDLALTKAGLSLRLRRSKGRCVQTVKADGPNAAGFFMRSEWEREVEGDEPLIDETSPLPAVLDGESVTPIFEVAVERRTWLTEEGEAGIELVLDRGRIIAGEKAAPICEVELELKSGPVPPLFALAKTIAGLAPVRLEVMTKSERGYSLRQPPRKAFKAEPVGLTDTMTTAEAFQQIIRNGLRQFRLNEDLVLARRSAEPLHQARVALRRMRSAFSIARPLVACDPASARFAGEMRWLAGELGRARDLDVLLGRAKSGALKERIKPVRDATYDNVDQVLDSARVRGLMLDLVTWLHGGDWLRAPENAGQRGEPVRAFAAERLDRLRRAVKTGGRALASADGEAHHELRKKAKKLRYATEFFQGAFHRKRELRRHKEFVGLLENLQDELGTLNDLATAPKVLQRLGLADHPEANSLLGTDDKPALIAAAAKAHGALMKAKRFWRLPD